MMREISHREVYALVDINNCYVSCERLFNPKLIDKPVVVLSNNDGCVVSRSEEAKLLGIKMGVPWFQIEKDALKAGVLASIPACACESASAYRGQTRRTGSMPQTA